MIYYINAFAQDTYALHITVARVHELDPDAIVYIASDAAAPVLEPIAKAHTITTQYPRGGNLRGTACIHGMLDHMQAILAKHDARYIVKLDADTYLNSIDWLRPETYDSATDLIFLEGYAAFSESGDCYAISATAIRAVLDGLTARSTEAAAHGLYHENLPEDTTIVNLTLRAGLPVRAIPFYLRQHSGVNCDFPDASTLAAAVIHCGEPLTNGQRAPREFVFFRLQTVWHLTHPTGTPIPGITPAAN